MMSGRAVIEEAASRMSDGLTFRDLVDIDRLHATARGIVHKVFNEKRIDAEIDTIKCARAETGRACFRT